MEAVANSTLTYRSFLARKYGRFGGIAMDDLAQHDKRFHPDGYKEGDSCKLRESLAESDAPDADVKPTQKTTPEAEYEAVVAAYTNPDGSKKPGWLKALNGADTNLTERQWVQVRTPSFKRWFGDWENDPDSASKIVDANGEPLVVYHGSYWNPLSEKDGEAIFDREKAKRKTDNGWYGRGYYFGRSERGVKMYTPDGGYVTACFLKMKNPNYRSTISVDPDFDSKKFDGVVVGGDVYYELPYSHIKNQSEYMVPQSNQIKSATDNTGAFSASDPDIRH